MTQRAFLAAVVCLLAAPAAFAGDTVLATIDQLKPGQLEVRGFYLDHPQEVRIEATGIDRTWRYGQVGDAWILDADSRKPVWELKDGRSRRAGRDLRNYDDRVQLPAGVYEVYYATFPQWGWSPQDGGHSWWGSVVRDLTGWDDFRDLVQELHIAVRGDGRPAGPSDLERSRRRISDAALISLTGLPDHQMTSRGFRLDRPMDVEIYAVGEVTKDGGFDYGWIVDTNSHEKVWTFTWRGSSRPAAPRRTASPAPPSACRRGATLRSS